MNQQKLLRLNMPSAQGMRASKFVAARSVTPWNLDFDLSNSLFIIKIKTQVIGVCGCGGVMLSLDTYWSIKRLIHDTTGWEGACLLNPIELVGLGPAFIARRISR